MANAERLLPEVKVTATRPAMSPPPNASMVVSEAANDAAYRTQLVRGGLVADALSLAGRALGALTLVFTPGNTGPDRTGELNEPLREPELDPVVVVSNPLPGPTPPGELDPRGAPDLVELPEIVIRPEPRERSNPLRLPTPDVLPDPLKQPLFEPFGVPGSEPFSPGVPGAQPRPSDRPESRPTPGVQADPLSDPFALPNPTAEPMPRPAPRPAPEPAPRPSPRAPAGPLALPFDPLRPFAQPESRPVPGDITNDLIDFVLRGSPEPSPDAQPEPELDKCNCDSKKKKKKKKDKPKDRVICYQGTYTQRARGISYSRKKQVPCAPAKSSSTPRRRTQNPLPFPTM